MKPLAKMAERYWPWTQPGEHEGYCERGGYCEQGMCCERSGCCGRGCCESSCCEWGCCERDCYDEILLSLSRDQCLTSWPEARLELVPGPLPEPLPLQLSAEPWMLRLLRTEGILLGELVSTSYAGVYLQAS